MQVTSGGQIFWSSLSQSLYLSQARPFPYLSLEALLLLEKLLSPFPSLLLLIQEPSKGAKYSSGSIVPFFLFVNHSNSAQQNAEHD